MPIVAMPDGTQVSFPDEMPREQIRGMIAQKFPDAGNAGASSVENGRMNTVTVRPAGPSGWDKAAEVATGLGKAVDLGAAHMVAGIGGAAGDIANLGAAGIHALRNGIENFAGWPETPAPDRSQSLMNHIPTSESMLENIKQNQYGGEFYKPQNTLEEYAKTGGEFLLGGVGGAGRRIAQRLGQVLLPAATSETAGQLTKGKAAEPYARFGGALVGGGIASLASRPGTSAQSIRQQLPEGVTPQMVDQAEALIQAAGQRGIQLAWPEALSQVAGRPVLTNMMRHLEASPQTEGRMAQFFGERPQQVEQAARREFDNIAPVNNTPSAIGPAVGRAAEDTVKDLHALRTREVTPFYQAARNEHVPTPEVQQFVNNIDAAIASDKTGIVGSSLKEIRRLLVEKPAQAAVPAERVARDTPKGKIYEVTPGRDAVPEQYITDIENLDRVRKYVRDKVEMPQIGQDAITKEQGAGIMKAIDDLKARMLAASENFRKGKERYEEITTKYLDPLLNGTPLGKLANRDIETKDAINVLFPKNPLPRSQDEVATAVSAVARRNPKSASDLVRAHAEMTFNEAVRDLTTGPASTGGAKFRVAIAGNPQQAANLEAAVTALPNGAARWTGFNRFLDILEATGTRQNIGSRTAYNVEINKAQGAGGLVRDAGKVGANPTRLLQPLADRYDQWKLGRNLGQLANILTDPRSGNMLRAIANAPNESAAASVAIKLLTYAEASK